MYGLIRKALFTLEPEAAHDFTLTTLNRTKAINRLLFGVKKSAHSITVMGLSFPNQVGLAAGLDKNAEYIDGLAALGFGFIEVGTVTPKPQAGNAKPRIFRLPNNHALINRLGFNNKGVDYLVRKVKNSQYKGILGINIGKNALTPNERAVDDYITCLQKVYSLASYITVNISSPNTKNLRELQDEDQLYGLLQAIKQEQQALQLKTHKYTPIAVKVAPDLTEEQIATIAKVLLELNIDGLIATNTTIGREGLTHEVHVAETGGLSGKPLHEQSVSVVQRFSELLEGSIPIIGVGGIDSVDAAQDFLDAGADLVQIYTGFIYKGPRLISEIAAS